jgi:carbon monoxide dehydrogenase subunit G
MQLEHSFTVPVEVEQAWRVLLDIKRIAPCMPGAALDSVDGDTFTGSVKVRLGPIGLTYKGRASLIEKDEAAHRAVIDAQAKDARGNGTAAAKVTATLTADPAGTAVRVVTDLNITGKPAQFGRGVMVDVGNKLIGQFAECLAGKLTGGTEPVATSAPVRERALADQSPAAEQPPPVRPAVGEVQPIDLLGSAGPAAVKRLAPLAAALAGVILLIMRRRRRS